MSNRAVSISAIAHGIVHEAASVAFTYDVPASPGSSWPPLDFSILAFDINQGAEGPGARFRAMTRPILWLLYSSGWLAILIVAISLVLGMV